MHFHVHSLVLITTELQTVVCSVPMTKETLCRIHCRSKCFLSRSFSRMPTYMHPF